MLNPAQQPDEENVADDEVTTPETEVSTDETRESTPVNDLQVNLPATPETPKQGNNKNRSHWLRRLRHFFRVMVTVGELSAAIHAVDFVVQVTNSTVQTSNRIVKMLA